MMSEWRECKLGEILTLEYGKAFKDYQESNGQYPVYGTNGKIGYADVFLCPVPGIILGRKGAYRGVHFSNEPFFVIDTAFYIKPKHDDIDVKYLYNFLLNQNINAMDSGSAIPSTDRHEIYNIDLQLPPLSEQRAIASILSGFDDKIDLLQRQNKTLEAMAEALFRQWFVEDAEEDNSVPISNLIDFNPPRTLPKGSIAPYLEMANVSTSVFHPAIWYDREYGSGMKFTNGDTLLARITPCLENGKSAHVTFLNDGQVGWGSTEFIVMRSKERLHPLFTYALTKNADFRDYAEGCLEGSSGRQRVNVDHLSKFEIRNPQNSFVQNFNSIMNAIGPKLQNNFIQVRTLEKMRDTLLPKLMSGEVRVKV